MEAEWSLQDAKNRFSAVVKAALAGEPQKVTRRGRWVGVVLSAAEYERLRRLDQTQAPTLPDLLLALPQDDESFARMGLTPREFPYS
jgi:antitoxin Phd